MKMLSKFAKAAISMLLVCCMLCSMGIAAFASEGESDTSGQQEAEDPLPETTYSWRNPLTNVLYTDLTLEEYQLLLAQWANAKAAPPAKGKEVPEAPLSEAETETPVETQEPTPDATQAAGETQTAQEPTATEETQAAQETAATEVTQAAQEPAATDETQATQEVVATDETQAAQETAATEVTQAAQETAATDETQAAQEVAATDETQAAQEVAATDETQAAQETAATEGTQATDAAEAAKEDYYVDYIVGDKVVKVGGSQGISIPELLTALGVEIPEGAEITLDPNSVDTKNLTVTEKDGVQVLTSNGTFYEADRDLVVMINGVATTIKVKDPIAADEFIKERQNKETRLTDKVSVNDKETLIFDSGKTEIDLNGKSIEGGKDTDYLIEVKGGDTVENQVSVTFKNGTISAVNGAIKVVGNAVVNFVNMTVQAAKDALYVDGTKYESADKKTTTVTTVNMDKKSDFITTSEHKNSPQRYDTVIVKGEADLYLNGDITNKGNGYAIAEDCDPKATSKKTDIYLGSKAEIAAVNRSRDLDPAMAADVDSGGASFAHKKDLTKRFLLVMDLNYDTDYRYKTANDSDDVPDCPYREGYTFKGWNTKANGAGKYVSGKYAMAHDIEKVYAIWEADYVVPDYAWLVKATVEDTNEKTYTPQTRITISKKTANVFFPSGSQHLSPVTVEFKDVQKLKDMGAEYAKIHLDENLYLELDLDNLLERAEKLPNGKKVNTFLVERDEKNIIQVSSGETAVFCFDAQEMMNATKNDLTISFERNGIIIRFGNDEICDTKLPEEQFSMIKLDVKESVLSISKATPKDKK